MSDPTYDKDWIKKILTCKHKMVKDAYAQFYCEKCDGSEGEIHNFKIAKQEGIKLGREENMFCPIWQCGGTLKAVEGKGKGEDDWQLFSLQCDNFKEHHFVLEQEATQKTLSDVEKMIEKLENPYPKDIFIGKTEEGRTAQFGHKVWDNFRNELKQEIQKMMKNV